MAKEYKDEIKYTFNGRNITFKTEPNSLNNNQMWWFEPHKMMFAGSVRDAKSIAKDIRKTFNIK